MLTGTLCISYGGARIQRHCGTVRGLTSLRLPRSSPRRPANLLNRADESTLVRDEMYEGKENWPVIYTTENMDVHCKAYIQSSMDQAIKRFQTETITDTGDNITYSEAVRRLILMGLADTYGGIAFVS